jgi:multiple sugar transport system substrate-binding protein
VNLIEHTQLGDSRRGNTRRQVVLGGTAACGLAAGSFLAACGGSRAEETKWSATRAPVAISVLTRAGPFGHTGWYKDVTPRVFEKQFPNIKVEWDEATGGGVTVAQKLLTHAAGGTLPEVSWVNAVGDGGHDGIAKGVFAPLDPMIKAEKFDRSPYWKAALEVMTYKGQLYGLPTHGHYGANIIYVNLQLTRAAGITVPLADANWTTDQFIQMAKQITRPDRGEWGFWPGTDIGQNGVMWLRTFGADFLSPDGMRCVLDTAEAQAALDWLWGVPNRFQVLDSLRAPGGSTRRFEEGKLAFMNQTPGLVAEWKKPGQERVKHELGITVVPKHASTGKRGTQVNAPSMALTKEAKQPVAGWEWIKFITNRDNGVDQVQGGAGSPGARHDVWNDERLHKLDPIYRLIERTYRQPGPVHLPHNATWFETTDVVNKTFTDLWDGKIGVREAAQQATRQAQAILDRGPG